MIPAFNYTSPGMSERLFDAGIKQKPSMWWQFMKAAKRWELKPAVIMGVKSFRAYSIMELGEFIPWGFFQAAPVHKMPGHYWGVKLNSGKTIYHSLEVEARAELLIDLITSKQVDIEEINSVIMFKRTEK
jgi:hypothetical protein